MQVITSLAIFPRLHKRIGTRGTMYFCTVAFLFSFLLPLLSSFFRSIDKTALFAVAFIGSLFAASLQAMVSSESTQRCAISVN